MSRTSDRPLFVHLIYVAEACLIAHWLHEGGVKHLHAHFGTNSAEVAMLVHVLGGPRWSFTAHGTETFDNPRLVGLTEKVIHCAFVVAVSSYGRAQVYRCVKPEYWHKVHVVHCGLDPVFGECQRGAPHFAAAARVCSSTKSGEGPSSSFGSGISSVERSIDFELILAGDGELRAGLEEKISRLQIKGPYSHYWLDQSQRVRDEILASRALVVPSLGEGLPVVITEAMSLGRPVIATLVGGIPELVRPGENGWLVPAGDAAALAEAMQACLDASDDVITRSGEAARKRVLEAFDADAEAAKLAELFYSAGTSSAVDKVRAAGGLARPQDPN